MLWKMAIAAVAFAACSSSESVPATNPDVVVPDAMNPLVEEYRITYVAEAIAMFGLTDADLEEVDVSSIRPKPFSDFPSMPDYDLAYAEYVAECLTKRGFPSSVILAPEGPGVDTGSIDLSDPAFMRSHGICVVEGLLTNPPRPRPATRAEWAVVYEEQVSTAECLSDGFGYSSDVPSLDAYIDDSRAWSAYDAVPIDSLGRDKWATVNDSCPQP